MDEPTSGLDARAAAIVMQAVRNVARNGRTVMVTIHQPSIEIFEAFGECAGKWWEGAQDLPMAPNEVPERTRLATTMRRPAAADPAGRAHDVLWAGGREQLCAHRLPQVGAGHARPDARLQPGHVDARGDGRLHGHHGRGAHDGGSTRACIRALWWAAAEESSEDRSSKHGCAQTRLNTAAPRTPTTTPTTHERTQAVKADWPTIYASSELAAENRAHADALVAEAQAAGVPALSIAQTYAQPFSVHVAWLYRKFNLMFWRNAPLNLTRVLMTTVTAFSEFVVVLAGVGHLVSRGIRAPPCRAHHSGQGRGSVRWPRVRRCGLGVTKGESTSTGANTASSLRAVAACCCCRVFAPCALESRGPHPPKSSTSPRTRKVRRQRCTCVHTRANSVLSTLFLRVCCSTARLLLACLVRGRKAKGGQRAQRACRGFKRQRQLVHASFLLRLMLNHCLCAPSPPVCARSLRRGLLGTGRAPQPLRHRQRASSDGNYVLSG